MNADRRCNGHSNTGTAASGIIAITNRGSASVIHDSAMIAPIAAGRRASSDSPCGKSESKVAAPPIKPKKSTVVLMRMRFDG